MRHANHSCKEVQSKIQLMIDGELNRFETADIKKVLEECPFCGDFYNNQQQFRKILHQSIERKRCGSQLRSDILNKIRGI